jgi:hypothetical protein
MIAGISGRDQVATVERQMDTSSRATFVRRRFPRSCRCGAGLRRENPRRASVCARRIWVRSKATPYHSWGQELPADDGFDQDFEILIGDRFLIRSPDEVASRFWRSAAARRQSSGDEH